MSHFPSHTVLCSYSGEEHVSAVVREGGEGSRMFIITKVLLPCLDTCTYLFGAANINDLKI